MGSTTIRTILSVTTRRIIGISQSQGFTKSIMRWIQSLSGDIQADPSGDSKSDPPWTFRRGGDPDRYDAGPGQPPGAVGSVPSGPLEQGIDVGPEHSRLVSRARVAWPGHPHPVHPPGRGCPSRTPGYESAWACSRGGPTPGRGPGCWQLGGAERGQGPITAVVPPLTP